MSPSPDPSPSRVIFPRSLYIYFLFLRLIGGPPRRKQNNSKQAVPRRLRQSAESTESPKCLVDMMNDAPIATSEACRAIFRITSTSACSGWRERPSTPSFRGTWWRRCRIPPRHPLANGIPNSQIEKQRERDEVERKVRKKTKTSAKSTE